MVGANALLPASQTVAILDSLFLEEHDCVVDPDDHIDLPCEAVVQAVLTLGLNQPQPR